MLVMAAVAMLPAQEKRDEPKRGDTVVVTGCVSRGRIESNDMKVVDGDGRFDRLTTYRLSGDKKVLTALKEEHENHVEILTAVLKSELPREGQARTVGNTRIGIGLPGRNDPAAPPSYPNLEVKSAEHTGKTCR
jgi:hypothetical protein